jgi:hypothetical protein
MSSGEFWREGVRLESGRSSLLQIRPEEAAHGEAPADTPAAGVLVA